MAASHIFPDEGLDFILGQFPGNTTRSTALGLCLFTSQTASTVMTSGQTNANVTASAYTNYVAQSMATATWGAAGAGASGRQRVYPQVTFPTVGASGSTINGFYIADATTPTKVICQANFDDFTAVVLATNDVIKVTATMLYLN